MTSAKTALMLGYKPTNDHNYMGVSDDGKCLIYRNGTNGEDYSLCVTEDTPKNWSALWEMKAASKYPQPNYRANVYDYLKDQRWLGSQLGLSKKGSVQYSYRNLARLADESGVDPAEDLSSEEMLSYIGAKTENRFAAAGVSKGEWVMATMVVGSLIFHTVAATIYFNERYNSMTSMLMNECLYAEGVEEKQYAFTCKTGNKEELHTCTDIYIWACDGPQIKTCVNCDGALYMCSDVDFNP